MNSLSDLLKSKAAQMPANQKLIYEALGHQRPQPVAEVQPGKFTPIAIERKKTCPRQIGSDEGLNQTEKAYLDWLLTMSDVRLWVQSIGLRLADRTFYYPDFAALDAQGMRFIDTKAIWKGETKPHVEDDSLCKIKWAAQIYAPCRFLIAWRNKDKVWQHREIKPS